MPRTILALALFVPAVAAAQQPPEQGTSGSGTQLMPVPPANAAPPTTAPAGDPALEQRVLALEQRMGAQRFGDRSRMPRETAEQLWWLRRFRVTGFVQPQLVLQFFNRAASPNSGGAGLPPGIGPNDVIAQPDGSTTSGFFFRLRRARLRTEFNPSDAARFTFEFDVGGAPQQLTSIAKTVEAVGIVKWNSDITTELAAGVFKPTFGGELAQWSPDRPFIERSWGQQNMFPGDYDTGARSSTKMLNKRLSFNVSVLNGRTQNERGFSLVPDLNKGKDLAARVSFDAGAFDIGVSGYYGSGQTVDPVGLRFKQYPRWAVNGEVGLHQKLFPTAGETRAFAEITYGQNMDRGVFYSFALPAIPADVTQKVVNLDQLSWFVRVEQDLGRYLGLGVRYDAYTPNTDISNNRRDTIGAVGVVRFTKGLEMRLEYARAIDNVHREGTPAPSKKIDLVSTVLQGRF